MRLRLWLLPFVLMLVSHAPAMADTPSVLEQAVGFEGVRHGKPLKLGDNAPAVAVIQTMLLLWNYPLELASVTGRYDEATAVAVLHFRLDFGLDEPFAGGGQETFAKHARTHGLFDAQTLAAFQGRLRAKVHQPIREIDPRRGLLIESPSGTAWISLQAHACATTSRPNDPACRK